MMNSKDIIDISYERIMDRVFKLKEKEKDAFTDRLQNMKDEDRAVDNILKINRLGVWSKGLQKGLTQYIADDNDSEKILMLKIAEMTQRVRDKTGATDKDLDVFMDEAMDDIDVQAEIDAELNLTGLNEDYMDGDPYGDEYNDQDE